MKAPCQGCTDRHLACHDTAPKYQAYHTEREKMYADKQIRAGVYEIFKDSRTRRLRKEKNHK